jgi:lipopolysaccharide export system permease protein
LNSEPESLALWQKLYSPITTIVMAVLAIPFVLGSQRQGNTGQRIVIGILLGLVFFVMSRLLTQLGQQLNVLPMLNALVPILAFLLLTVALIIRKTRNPS